VQRHIIILFFGLLLVACSKSDDIPPVVVNAEIDSILFLGDDLMAGYTNFGLTREKQAQAFPVLFLNQLMPYTGVEARVPYLPSALSTGGWELEGFNEMACQGGLDYPVFKSNDWNTSSLNQVFQDGPFNVIGIPRLTLSSAVRTDFYYRNLYFKRITSPNSPDANVYSLCNRPKPDLFVLHLGQGDIMRYALNGGVDAQGLPINLMPNLQFERCIDSLVRMLKSESNSGVLLNIPLPEYLPYFHTISNEYIDPVTCLSTGTPYYVETETGTVIEAGKWDKILLPAAGRLNQLDSLGRAFGLDIACPVPDRWVLDKQEYVFINNQVLQWNAILQVIADRYDLIYFDLNDLYKDLSKGQRYFGATFTTEYLEGDFFAIDGVSPLPRGHAMITNRLIESINQSTSSNIPPLDILSF
jgi:hypothetical protein